jgi:hypothetical protein
VIHISRGDRTQRQIITIISLKSTSQSRPETNEILDRRSDEDQEPSFLFLADGLEASVSRLAIGTKLKPMANASRHTKIYKIAKIGGL